MLGRVVLGLGLTLAAVAVIAVLLPGAHAAKVEFTPAAVREGETIAIKVSPTPGQSPDEVFSAGDKMVVTDPANCKYVLTVPSNLVGSGSAWTMNYPGSGATAFTNDTANAASCRSTPHTHLSQTAARPNWAADFTPAPLQSQNPFIPAVHGDFRVLLTDQVKYNRTAIVGVNALGFNPNQLVNLQIDGPGAPAVYTTQVRADEGGRVTHQYRLGKGQAADSDLGSWGVKITPTVAAPGKAEDRQTFIVGNTSLSVKFDAASVPPFVARANPLSVAATITYRSPGINASALPMVGSDALASKIDLVFERNGVQIAPITATYDAAKGRWVTSAFTVPKDAPAGSGYVVRVANNAKDAFGNRIDGSITAGFSVTNVTVTPQFTLLRTDVERANPGKGLSLDVRLTYPSGVPLTADDLKTISNTEGTLQGALYKGNARVPGSLFLGVFSSNGVWQFHDQVLPRDTPLGDLTFRLLPSAVNDKAAPANSLDTGLASLPVTVAQTAPSLGVKLLKDANEINGILRGQAVKVQVRALYRDGGAVMRSDINDLGHAYVVLERPSGDPVKLDLEYRDAEAMWDISYTPKPTDPVGPWTVTAVFKDNSGNENVTARKLQVGLQIGTQLSATAIARASNVTVTSGMSLPGSSDLLAGAMNLTLLDAAGRAVAPPVSMVPITGGKYQVKVNFPVDITPGAYRIVVRGASSSDSGQDIQTVNVGSSSLLVKTLNITATSAKRLSPVGLDFTLQYPNGGAPPASVVTATVKFQPKTGPAKDLVVGYDAARKAYRANFTPALDTPLGGGRFLVGAADASGNQLSGFTTSNVTVQPAEIRLTELQSTRAQSLRGEVVVLRARLSYVDGSLPAANLTVPLTLTADNKTQANLQLVRHGSVWEANYTLPLDAPLGSVAKPWRVTVAASAAKDKDGNVGPAQSQAATFGVNPAVLGVTILEQTKGTLGSGTVKVTFAITAPDGTRLSIPTSTLRAYIVRDGQLSNDTLALEQEGDHYVATLEVDDDLLDGLYAIRVAGADARGNAVTALDTQSFTIDAEKAKDSPGGGLVAAVLAVGLVGLALRSLRRRE